MFMKLEGSVITIPRLNEYRDIIRKSKAAAKEYQYLYHCTSIEGLKGMLNSNSFWLSNLQCVNDKEEANRISLPEYEKEYYVGCFTYEDKERLEENKRIIAEREKENAHRPSHDRGMSR